MSATYEDKDLIVVVSFLLNRQVRIQEALAALGMSRSTYYEQRDKGTLNSFQNIVAVADHFGLSRVELLVQLGQLTKDELLTYLEREGEVIGEVADGELDPPIATTVRTVRPQAKRKRKMRARTDIPPL